MRIVITTLLVIGALLFAARHVMPNLGSSAAGGVVRTEEGSAKANTTANAEVNAEANADAKAEANDEANEKAGTGSGVAEAPLTKVSLADCGHSPNCQGSASSREAQRVAPFNLRGTVEESMDSLVELIEAQPGAAVETRDANYLHATFTSKIMQYVDDVEFLIDAEREHIDVRSASRLGKSDLGANARRIESLRTAWEK